MRILAVIGVCVLLWISRRPEQLTSPYVWVEESFIVRNFLDDGWAGAFEPVQGYLVLSANLLFALAADISSMQRPELMYAFAFAVFLATVLLLVARRHEPLLLLTAAGVFTVLSAVPAPLISDPAGGGPRYFFLPFVALAWVLLAAWRYADVERLRAAVGVLLCLSLLGLATTFSRGSEATTARLSWEDQVRKCAASTESLAQIPIYFEGSTKLFWTMSMNPAECRRLAQTYSSFG